MMSWNPSVECHVVMLSSRCFPRASFACCCHTAFFTNINTATTTTYPIQTTTTTMTMMETQAAPMMEHDFAQQEGMEEEEMVR